MGLDELGGGQIMLWDWQWGGSEVVGHMSGDQLEDLGGLGFPKEAGGVVI